MNWWISRCKLKLSVCQYGFCASVVDSSEQVASSVPQVYIRWKANGFWYQGEVTEVVSNLVP